MKRFYVRDIADILFAAFPEQNALPNDRIGLLCGSPNAVVKRIAVALDATVPMIEQAHSADCNVLVTHHPAFWFAPDSFLAEPSPAISGGAAVFTAAAKGVALINMHSNLDCAPAAADILLKPVGLEYAEPLRIVTDNPRCAAAQKPKYPPASLGQIAVPAGNRGVIKLKKLAESYREAFGKIAKIWGLPDRPLHRIAVCSGGAGEIIPDTIRSNADCLVTGELRHHEALWLSDAGIAIIELGHDVSELPYRFKLLDARRGAGVPPNNLAVLEPSAVWWQLFQENAE